MTKTATVLAPKAHTSSSPELRDLALSLPDEVRSANFASHDFTGIDGRCFWCDSRPGVWSNFACPFPLGRRNETAVTYEEFTATPAKRSPYVEGCAYCDREKEAGNTFFPSHDASPRCRSGGHNHCTCDTCF